WNQGSTGKLKYCPVSPCCFPAALPRQFYSIKSHNSERDLFIDAVTLPSRAVLLDVDGTILDLAPTPLEVVVPPDLTVALERLSKRVGGALAFVSGRPLAELDLFFAPLKLPAIAGHGAELRLADGSVT